MNLFLRFDLSLFEQVLHFVLKSDSKINEVDRVHD